MFGDLCGEECCRKKMRIESEHHQIGSRIHLKLVMQTLKYLDFTNPLNISTKSGFGCSFEKVIARFKLAGIYGKAQPDQILV